ncbi:MAG: hypothetical protein WA790_20290 [Sulfitobacter sp.]
MSFSSAITNRTVVILSACQSPGAEMALACARGGARVVAIDNDAEGLNRLAADCPDRIEPLSVQGNQVETLRLLKDAWGSEPIHLVVNLMPLEFPHNITEQMRALTIIMRSMGRGLIAGKGALVTVTARPNDPLALVEQGMCGALRSAGASLASIFSPKSVRIHTVTVPKGNPELALETVFFLDNPQTRYLKNAEFDLSA